MNPVQNVVRTYIRYFNAFILLLLVPLSSEITAQVRITDGSVLTIDLKNVK